MAFDASTLPEFVGKNVILHKIEDDGSVTELEGKIEAGSEVGIAFREKGKRDVGLVEPNQIEEITAVAAKPKTLPQKKLKVIAEGAVRQHLLDRHGYARSQVNPMTEAEAIELHDGIDHSDLGHRHVAEDEKASAEAEAAVEASDEG